MKAPSIAFKSLENKEELKKKKNPDYLEGLLKPGAMRNNFFKFPRLLAH